MQGQPHSIDDKGAGYIKALAAPHQARVNQDAKIAQAAADQEAAAAQQASMRNQAEYARQTTIAQAQYQAEIDQAQQTAAQAGPLAAARAQQEVLVERALVAEKNAELRQAELIAEVIRPAQAEAERITTLARAQADATKLSAEAAAAQDRIAAREMSSPGPPGSRQRATQSLDGHGPARAVGPAHPVPAALEPPPDEIRPSEGLLRMRMASTRGPARAARLITR